MQDFTVTISPRFYETDALGHINNASIAAWFEVVRIGFLDDLAEGDSGVTSDWVLASMQIDFIAETFYGSDVIARICEASIGNSSFTVMCEMTQGEKVTVRGKAVLVHLDPSTKSPARISDHLREALAAR